MLNLDPDVIAVLELIAEGRRRNHVRNVKSKQYKNLKERFNARLETITELVFDEVEKVINPKQHPARFVAVVVATVDKKLNDLMHRDEEEPEFKSDLDHFPPNW